MHWVLVGISILSICIVIWVSLKQVDGFQTATGSRGFQKYTCLKAGKPLTWGVDVYSNTIPSGQDFAGYWNATAQGSSAPRTIYTTVSGTEAANLILEYCPGNAKYDAEVEAKLNAAYKSFKYGCPEANPKISVYANADSSLPDLARKTSDNSRISATDSATQIAQYCPGVRAYDLEQERNEYTKYSAEVFQRDILTPAQQEAVAKEIPGTLNLNQNYLSPPPALTGTYLVSCPTNDPIIRVYRTNDNELYSYYVKDYTPSSPTGIWDTISKGSIAREDGTIRPMLYYTNGFTPSGFQNKLPAPQKDYAQSVENKPAPAQIKPLATLTKQLADEKKLRQDYNTAVGQKLCLADSTVGNTVFRNSVSVVCGSDPLPPVEGTVLNVSQLGNAAQFCSAEPRYKQFIDFKANANIYSSIDASYRSALQYETTDRSWNESLKQTACQQLATAKANLQARLDSLRSQVQDLSGVAQAGIRWKNENISYQNQFAKACDINLSDDCKTLATQDRLLYDQLATMDITNYNLFNNNLQIQDQIDAVNYMIRLLNCQGSVPTFGSFSIIDNIGYIDTPRLKRKLEEISPYYISPDVVQYLSKLLTESPQAYANFQDAKMNTLSVSSAMSAIKSLANQVLG
jgi:hypothetical protein